MHCEVPAEAGVAAHVFQRIDLHKQGDERDQPEHHDGEAVDEYPPAYGRAARGEPCDRVRAMRCAAAEQVGEDVPEEREACCHCQNGDEGAAHGQPASAERDDDEGGGAKGGD